jgi:hypothetical protein
LLRIGEFASLAGSGRLALWQAVAHQFRPGSDAKLGEDLAQVVVDRTRTEVEPCGDVPVGQALGDKPGDLEFLRCQLVQRGGIAFARGLAGSPQFGFGAFLPENGAEPVEQFQRRAQMGACLLAPPFASQPLAEQQFGTGPLKRRQRQLHRAVGRGQPGRPRHAGAGRRPDVRQRAALPR